jgi:hypothetical protein
MNGCRHDPIPDLFDYAHVLAPASRIRAKDDRYVGLPIQQMIRDSVRIGGNIQPVAGRRKAFRAERPRGLLTQHR